MGLTKAQAEQMTDMLKEVVCLNREKVVQQFVSKPALEKVGLFLSGFWSCCPAMLNRHAALQQLSITHGGWREGPQRQQCVQ